MCDYASCNNPGGVTILNKSLCAKHHNQWCDEGGKGNPGFGSGKNIEMNGEEFEILIRKPTKMAKSLFTKKQMREDLGMDI
jgi:hypothetical protein